MARRKRAKVTTDRRVLLDTFTEKDLEFWSDRSEDAQRYFAEKTFEYPLKAEAEAFAADLKARGKGNHFVRSLKEAMSG